MSQIRITQSLGTRGPEELPVYQREGQQKISARTSGRRETEAKRTATIIHATVNREKNTDKMVVRGTTVQEAVQTIYDWGVGVLVDEEGVNRTPWKVQISEETWSNHEVWREKDTGTLTIMLVDKSWWNNARGRNGEEAIEKLQTELVWRIEAYTGALSGDRGECNESSGTTDDEKGDFYKPRRRPGPKEEKEALDMATNVPWKGPPVRTEGEKGKSWRILNNKHGIRAIGWTRRRDTAEDMAAA